MALAFGDLDRGMQVGHNYGNISSTYQVLGAPTPSCPHVVFSTMSSLSDGTER